MHVFVSKCTCLTSAWLPAGLIGFNTWGEGGGGGGVRAGGENSKVTAQQQKQAPPSSVPSQVMLCISNHPAKKKAPDIILACVFSRLVLLLCHSARLLHYPIIVSFIVLRLV